MATNFRSAVGAQEPRKTVSLDGVVIAFTDSIGQGPVIICLHAIGHGAGDFQNLSRRFGLQYRVIALDFPGHGNSGPDSQPACAARYSQILQRFIDSLKLDSVILLGNSIGGAVSIRYAAEHPERVQALVLCNTGGLDSRGPLAAVFTRAFVRFFAAGRRRAFWFPWAFARYYRKVLSGEAGSEQRERIIRSAYEVSPILEEAWRSFGRPDEDLRGLLPRIQCPVLVAWAKDDFSNQLTRCRPALDLFPNHCLEVFEGGHAAFLEDPDRFEQSLCRFLEDVYVAQRGNLVASG
jgi:pimeloyl-ACP methyl ester carboxylesterase